MRNIGDEGCEDYLTRSRRFGRQQPRDHRRGARRDRRARSPGAGPPGRAPPRAARAASDVARWSGTCPAPTAVPPLDHEQLIVTKESNYECKVPPLWISLCVIALFAGW